MHEIAYIFNMRSLSLESYVFVAVIIKLAYK